jgi:hypothetical protein
MYWSFGVTFDDGGNDEFKIDDKTKKKTGELKYETHFNDYPLLTTGVVSAIS